MYSDDLYQKFIIDTELNDKIQTICSKNILNNLYTIIMVSIKRNTNLLL